MMLKKWLMYLIFAAIIFFTPQIGLILVFNHALYDLNNLPAKNYGILFGARVYDDNELSPIAKQRADAVVAAYQQEKIRKIFVSGTNSANLEVDSIASYLVTRGVADKDITRDYLGFDTSDSCRHFKIIGNEAILFTQKFHLPRALYMCKSEGIVATGLVVNFLPSTDQRDSNLFQIIPIRIQRYSREALLTWSYLLGLYDKISSEAEMLESNSAPSLEVGCCRKNCSNDQWA